MVKNYQDKKEYLVLSMVKKYPLFSVEKLAKELPGISRHSIQRILEKNNLSTIEKRLEFSSKKELKFLSFLERLKAMVGGWRRKREISFIGFKKLFKHPQEILSLNGNLIKSLLVLGLIIWFFWQGWGYISAQPPEIQIDKPEKGFAGKGEKLFVSGKVVPACSQVTINSNKVALNGDGSFTAIVSIPVGESTLEFEAVNKRKRSQVLQLVNRELTEEELQAKQEEEAQKRREAANRVAEVERTVNDLLAAKNASAGEAGILRVLNSRIKEDAGFYSVVGEVANLGKEEVTWVMITAKFYNQTGGEVDSRFGFATDFGEVIKPGEKAEFETQATTKEFDHYSLELSWEKGEVAGVSAEIKEEATISGEVETEVE